jgi:hypothetical protein
MQNTQTKKAVKGKTQIIKILGNPNKPYKIGTARSQYWLTVKTYNGKTVAQLQQAITANPPSQPTRGKLAGKTEPLSGWLAFFAREGLLQIVAK